MMDMTNILDMLVQAIDEDTTPFPLSKGKYRSETHRASQHLQWLEEHLNEEEKTHLEAFRNAELSISTMENQALIRTALAVGIRLALPC